VPGGTGDLSWLSIPEGTCAHPFATVGNARQLRFAPGGELFVASPATSTTGGGSGGQSAIVVLPDDDRNGLADPPIAWRIGLPSTQGLLFAAGFFYFQDGTQIFREPYASGQRAPLGSPTSVADIQVFVDQGHWPKTLDVAEDGTIYVSNGGNQVELCDPARPFHGGILALDSAASGGARQVAKGLRNPINVKCHRDGHNLCFATELALDYSAASGGREKLIPIRDGDDWGYPCCATRNLPYLDVCLVCSAATETLAASSSVCAPMLECSPKCDQTVAEPDSFVIGNTPFGFDFIDNQFSAPWTHHVIVTLHGEAGTWKGAKVVAIAFDSLTGIPLPGSSVAGLDGGAMSDFLTGWDDGQRKHGRPADVALAADGRLFFANDVTGEIFWLAPLGP
jgi:glucose/arabinose dehydrogenase